ncbi:MAG: hypothetical protein Q7V53_07205 [Caldisericota bacterium]|nr:hypothetical protein [Caldisericota bacterium]
MPVLDSLQTSFEFGELSPRLLARIDLPAYRKGLKTQENSYTYLHGGATKRRGSLFIGELRNSSQRARPIPYTFDETNQFLLIFNDGRIEFIKDGAFIETSPGVRYSITSPYTESQLADIRYTQPGNTMFLAHKAHHPQQLSRISDTNWVLANIPFIYNAVSDVTFSNAFITFKLINGSVKFVKDQEFTVTTVAGVIGVISGPTGGVSPGNGQIAAVARMPGPAVTETWTIKCTFASDSRQEWSVIGSVSGAASAYWRIGNYPQSVASYDQRLYFGGSPQYPQHVWGSGAGDFLNMTVGNRENDGVILQILSNDHAAIQHLVGARNIMPMTTSTEFSLSGINNSSVSGIASNSVKDHTRHGSSAVRPIRIGREVVFAQRDGKKLRAISYSVTEDANVAPDITIFAEHMSRAGTFTDMTFAAAPDYIAWIVRSDGQLLSLTLARDYETTAWARHTTDGLFESVASLPGAGVDDVYFVVKRTINGVEKRYVEMFDYEDVDTIYSDCSVYYAGTPIATVPGFDHLVGKTLSIVADGVVHPPRTVNEDGEIELQRPASTVLAGLPFTMTLEMLHPEFGDANATSQGKRVMITDVIVRFFESVAAKVNGVEVLPRSLSDGLDSAPDPFTGDKKINGASGWSSPHNILIQSDNPTPLTVLGVIVRGAVN